MIKSWGCFLEARRQGGSFWVNKREREDLGWIVNDGRIKGIWEAFAGRFVIIINIIIMTITYYIIILKIDSLMIIIFIIIIHIIFNAKGVFVINLINILIVLITMMTAVRLEININEVMMVS